MILGEHSKALGQQFTPATFSLNNQQQQQPIIDNTPKLSRKIRTRYSSMPNMLSLTNNKPKPLMDHNTRTLKPGAISPFDLAPTNKPAPPVPLFSNNPAKPPNTTPWLSVNTSKHAQPKPLFSTDFAKPAPPVPLFPSGQAKPRPSLVAEFAKPTLTTSPKTAVAPKPKSSPTKPETQTLSQKRVAEFLNSVNSTELFAKSDLYTSFAAPPQPKKPATASNNVTVKQTNPAPRPMPMKPRQSMPVGAVFRFAPYQKPESNTPRFCPVQESANKSIQQQGAIKSN